MGDIRNANRFMGFAGTYDDTRPRVPFYPVEIITRYLLRKPVTVLDLGCGTGLSTEIWKGHCDKILGIEPSPDMIAEARKKECPEMSFIQAFGDHVPLPDHSADAIVCSQSFHWMDPAETLKEVNRLLTNSGIFATIDYDWPPVMKWQAEKAFLQFQQDVKIIRKSMTDLDGTSVRYDKSHHLENIANSGFFCHVREILFANREPCTPQRLAKLPLSLGSIQTIMKRHPHSLDDALTRYEDAIYSICPESFEIDVCYRMRLGIKA